MSENKFLIESIDKKEKRLKRVMIENVGLAGIIGVVAGYVLSEAYTNCLVNGAMFQIYIILAFTAIGIAIGYIDGKAKAEELKMDLMLLHDLNKRVV